MVKLFSSSDAGSPSNTELTPILAYSATCTITTQTKPNTVKCLVDISADHKRHNCLTIIEQKSKALTKTRFIKAAEVIKSQNEGFN